MQAKQIKVYGRVQGVGFRYFVQKVAIKLGLRGDVCNSPDGTVEILVEGSPEDIESLIEQVRQGPPLSLVQKIDAVDVPVKGSYSSFLIEGY